MTALDRRERLERLLRERDALISFAFVFGKPSADSRRFRLAYRFGCDCETEQEHVDRIFGVRP